MSKNKNKPKRQRKKSKGHNTRTRQQNEAIIQSMAADRGVVAVDVSIIPPKEKT